MKNANEDILKKPSITSIEVKKGEIFQKFFNIIFGLTYCLSKDINTLYSKWNIVY